MPPRFEHEHDDEHEDDLVAAPPRCASVVNSLPCRPKRPGYPWVGAGVGVCSGC